MKEKQIIEILDSLINKEITFDEARDKLFILYNVAPRSLSLENYWNSNTSEDRIEIVERAFKMIVKQMEYIALLNEELNLPVGIASVHGWKSNLVKKGEKLREEMFIIYGA